MLIHQSPPHFSILELLIKDCSYSIMILNFYGPYCGFFKQNGFIFPMFMKNSFIRILVFGPSLKNNPKIYSLPRSIGSSFFLCNYTIQFDVIIQFLDIFLIIECDQICTNPFFPCLLGSIYFFPVLIKIKHSFVYFIWVTWRNVYVLKFWSPYLQGCFTHHQRTLCGYTLTLLI